jgi:predicted unusual protein kinase regulating ubiquinone biosynthesis (AarF/ABC1/UbiB family)
MRLLRVYATTLRVAASYLWLRLWRPVVGHARYETLLVRRHGTNARRIERAIVRAGGLFIKVGQLISILSNVLPEEFRRELEGLQDQLPPRPFDEMVAQLRGELGAGPDELFASFDRAPIATASLAQVHAARLADGRKVAVKVQHADIEQIARADLAVVRRILRIVQLFTGVRGLESYPPEISQLIAQELDFTTEAGNIARIAAHFAGDPTVRCPVVVPERSTRRVLTTELIDGTKITDFATLEARGIDRRRLAERVVTAYCKMIFVDGVYHADPHPGNIFVAADGAIAFVDFGAVGVVAPQMRAGIPEFLDGIIRRDPPRITAAIRAMGFVSLDPKAGDVAQRVIDYAQRKYFEQAASGSFTLADLQVDVQSKLDAIADLRRLDVSFRTLTSTFQVPRDWVVLERTLLLLIGLCTELDAAWNPMTVIRRYLEDVVFGHDRDWSGLLGDSFKAFAANAAAIPETLHATLARANRGDLQVRVPEIAAAARLLYAGMRQLMLTAMSMGLGVVTFDAYDHGRGRVAVWTGAGFLVCLVALLISFAATDRNTR